MRKILLATTAVAGFALVGGTASAQMQSAPEQVAPRAMGSASPGVTVRLGGFFNFQGAYINDSADKAALGGPAPARTLGRRPHSFIQETEIYVFADGQTASGLRYGFEVQFQIDGLQATSIPGNGTGFNTDEAFGYISGSWGTFKFGDEDSAGSLMQVRRPGIVGLDSDSYWDEQTVGASNSRLTGINDGGDQTKIIYMTPQFFGFDFGVSYAPNGTEGDRATVAIAGTNTSLSGQRDRTTLQDEISYVARYRGTVAGVGIAASFAGQTAGAPQFTSAGAVTTGQQVTAYSAGLSATAYGLTIGGEYTWGQYSGVSVGRAPIAPGRNNSTHYVVAASYNLPGLPVQVGGFFGHATQDINGTPGSPEYRQTVWGVGANYTIAPGLVGFTSYTRMVEKNNFSLASGGFGAGRPASQAGGGRDANIALLGLRLAF